MKSGTTYLTILSALAILLTACTTDPNSPGVEFMPDMYRSVSYETYGENTNFGGEHDMEARTPVEGTVPRGWYTPYPYGSSDSDRVAAAAEVRSPLPFDAATVADGKVLYNKFCDHCHGAKGAADGEVVAAGHAPPPAYTSAQLKDISEGQIYHAIMRGKGVMGSHASQIEEPDRWKIVRYVQTLQGKEIGSETSATADSTQAEPATPEETN